VKALNDGWVFQGQSERATGRKRGTPCRHVAPAAFLHCLSNHDQIGNHAFGERLGHRILSAARRAADAVLCLTPYTPMIFMGQEWNASTPFCFFTDHQPELGELIKAGRRNEFGHFAAFRDPKKLDTLPDPQSSDTFIRSKLNWEECGHGEHASTLKLYQTLLELRANQPVFRPQTRDTWKVGALQMGIGAIRWHGPESDWLLLFDLLGNHEGSFSGEPLCKLQAGFWEVMLSTNESRFGGEGGAALEPRTMMASFRGPEAVLLRAFPL
jgi:maltooligosyltrehalose trehalohydrolase